MDVARPNIVRKRRRKRLLYTAAALGVLTATTVGISQLKPALPLVENVYTDAVKRGEMPLQVRGSGILVPEEIVWIATLNAARVEKILVMPGATVTSDTVLVELNNPEIEQTAVDSELQLKAAESELISLRAQLETQTLNQQASMASAQANYSNAKLEFDVNEGLAKAGLVPTMTLKQSKTKADELSNLLRIEKERLRISTNSALAQIAVQQAKVAQFRAAAQLKKKHAEALKVRAGIDGVLQKLGDAAMLQVGQQLPAGANVARVANPVRLKAEIRIAETQAKDVVFNLKALIDTRNGVIEGHVVRIDPGVQNGTRTVDIVLDSPLPKGAVPDLTVEGAIELERLDDVLYLSRPVNAAADSTLGLFKVVNGGKEAVRVSVKLGRTSVSAIQILAGLDIGDKIVLSDMSGYDAYERVRIK
jgi:HlyD family secretion protein